MATYHFDVGIIGRSRGSTAVQLAAYRSASRLYDARLGRTVDFTHKNDVIHSEVMLPEHAPEIWRDRERLWNDVEACELRTDSRLARDIVFSVPRELGQKHAIALARDFVCHEFVSIGMIADLNVHWHVGVSGQLNSHAHVMLTTRHVGPEGFGTKNQDWDRRSYLIHWRESWANYANERLARFDIEARIDHRSLAARGIELEPQSRVSLAVTRIADNKLASFKADQQRAEKARRGVKVLANPVLALDRITRDQAMFTDHDLARFVRGYAVGEEQFDMVMKAVKSAPELVAIGTDHRGDERYTSLDMVTIERRAGEAATLLCSCDHHQLDSATVERAITRSIDGGRVLGYEQQAALAHVTRGNDLAIVISDGAAAKGQMLAVARECWEQAGYKVRGIALSQDAAQALDRNSGIQAQTLASFERDWDNNRTRLTSGDITVIDEAGLIGTCQIGHIVAESEQQHAKLVLIGDIEQAQASEAGAVFRSMIADFGAVEIGDGSRHRDFWQRMASGQLGLGRAEQAITAYDGHGMVHDGATRSLARDALIEHWDQVRRAAPGASRIILAATLAEVGVLNAVARARMRYAGDLGDDVTVNAVHGSAAFALGDRIVFLRNERDLGVRAGMLGTLLSVDAHQMAVALDDGRSVGFDPQDYPHITRGYAVVVDRTPGLSVAHAHVLVTPSMDRHSAYLALTRHTETLDLHYGRDEFADRASLIHTLSLKRNRHRTHDLIRGFAERRSLVLPRPPQLRRDRFGGIHVAPATASARPITTETPFDFANEHPTPFDGAVARYAQAAQQIIAMRRGGCNELPHQLEAFRNAGKALNSLHRDAERDMRHALDRDHRLIEEAANGHTAPAIRAMLDEAEVRTNPVRRADRFISDWRTMNNHELAARQVFDERGAARAQHTMAKMAQSLGRDPQLETLLRARRLELGIREISGASLSHDLDQWLGRSRGRGLGL